MQLTRDVTFINRIMNDPSVFPHISCGVEYPLDFSGVMANESNLFYGNEHGGFLAVHLGDNAYDIHTQFLPEGRGAAAYAAARQFVDFMFSEMGAALLLTVVPWQNHPARRLAESVGFRKVSEVGIGDVYELRGEQCQPPQS